MWKAVTGLGVIGAIVLGVVATAAADDGNRKDDGEHHRAPEPITALALAGGAGAALVARWAMRRKSSGQ
jgi:hypothetical protein